MNKEQRIKAWFNSLTPEQKRDFDELLTDFDTFTQFAQARRGNGKNFIEALFVEVEWVTGMSKKDIWKPYGVAYLTEVRTLMARWLKQNTLMTVEQIAVHMNRHPSHITWLLNDRHPFYAKEITYKKYYMELNQRAQPLLKQYKIKEEQ